MKIDETTVMALGVLAAAWVVMRKATGTTGNSLIPAFAATKNQRQQVGAATPQLSTANSWAQTIYNNAAPGDIGYGWTYYSDGTSISPDGSYYTANGAKVWSPTA